ncbi:MAG: PEP-CTERM sorting domain-containing protein [Opitutaceae bacterium]
MNKTSKFAFLSAGIMLFSSAHAAQVVADWGVAGGNTDIVGGAENFDNNPGTTSLVSAYDDATYNSGTTTLASPLFSTVATNFQGRQVQNNNAFDRIRITQSNADTDGGSGNFNDWEAAFVWDATLDAGHSLDSFSYYGFRSGNTTAPLYFLVEDDNGWFAAQVAANPTVGPTETISMADVTAETWYSLSDFDMSDRTDSVNIAGGAQTVNFDAVTSVGIYTHMSGNTTATGNALYIGHFNATAVPEPSSFALLAGSLALSGVMMRRRVK